MSKEVAVNRDVLVNRIRIFKEDVETIFDCLDGKITLEECWDVGSVDNWFAVTNLLDDLDEYLSNVVEEDVDDEDIDDDTPPEDTPEEELELTFGYKGSEK